MRRERRKPKKDNRVAEAFDDFREAMRPVYEEQKAVEERELPKRAERLRANHITINVQGGNCPVQIEGHAKGKPFYFRARGESWSIGIGGEPVGEPDWYYEEEYGSWPDAGWMPLHEAYDFLIKAVEQWRSERKGQPQ